MVKIDKLVIAIIVFFIIGFLSYIPINWGMLDPIGKSMMDFEIYDIVFSKIRVEQNLDSNIVIVNIGKLDRNGIANQIHEISKYNPKVIGLDAFFLERRNNKSDSLLISEVASIKNLVLINKLTNYNKVTNSYESVLKSFFDNNNSTVGYANLPEEKTGGYKTIRGFKPSANFKNKTEYSFAAEIVKKFNPQSYTDLIERNNEIEIINYRGNYNKFFFIDVNAVNKGINLDFIKGKIVLMGFVGTHEDTLSLEDKFFTPLNERYAGKTFPDMYGVVIHANIISMILNRNFINEFPITFNYILAFIICYLNVSLLLFIKSKLFDWFGGLSKLVILFQTVFLLIAGILLFHLLNYKVYLTLFMVVIALVPTSIDFYQNYIYRLFSKEKNENKRYQNEEVNN